MFKKKETRFKIFKKSGCEYYVKYSINMLFFTMWVKMRECHISEKYKKTKRDLYITFIPWLFAPIVLYFGLLPMNIIGTIIGIAYIIVIIINLVYFIGFLNNYESKVMMKDDVDDMKYRIQKYKEIQTTKGAELVAETTEDGTYLEGKDLLRLKKFKNIIK